MKVPVRWLKELVPNDLSAEEIGRRLTMAGLEAEAIERIGAGWENVYVGMVQSVTQHPNADRLVLAHVVAGEHELTVVTGAPNIAEGQTVPLALAGATLIDPYADELKYRKLKPSSIRGVRSEGMVCSEKELGLSDEHEGIMVLEEGAPLGTPLTEWLGDEVIEFEITPNLVHAFSILGIARELAALIEAPSPHLPSADLKAIPRDDSHVEIQAPEHCGRFTFTLFENVTIEESPTWLQRRLIHAGLRPINNYVDISNYVMLEMGHPTHPFDAGRLASDDIIVRLARDGEKITTIDHVERELDGNTLVIADRERAVGIAGIMGGVDTEVTAETSRVMIESAWFEATSVRRSTRHLKLNTDASARFGRDIDPNGASQAAARYVELVRKIDPGANAVLFADRFLRPREPRAVSMKYSEIERLLGMEIPLETAVAILTRLDLQPAVSESTEGTIITCTAPTYRNDINLPADLVEEVARVHGYEHLPETLITGTAVNVWRDPARLTERAAQDALVEAGLFQVQTYTMVSEADLVALSPANNGIPELLGGYPRPEADFVRAVNPLRSDWELMRPTMIPSLLKVAAENLKFSDRVAIFETARTYQPEGLDRLPDERRAVTIVMAGARDEFGLYCPAPGELDFFDLKGAIETLMERLGAPEASLTRVQHPSFHPGRAAALELDGVQVGIMGEVHPRVAARFGIDIRTAAAEIDLQAFIERTGEVWSARPVGRHQPVMQDFAFFVDEATAAGDVETAIRGAAGPLATEVRLFDIYRDESIGEGKQSLAFRVTFSAPDRQPAEHELERIRQRIEQAVSRQVGGSLRT